MNKLKQYNPFSYFNTKQKTVFIFFLLLSVPFNLITEPTSGMEASWRIGLNMCLQQGLVWGKDVVFTYGPLAFLQTRLALYVTEFPIILFSVFVWLNVVFIFFYFLRQVKLFLFLDFFIALLIVLMFHYIVKIEVSTTLVYIILFQLLFSLKHTNYFFLIIANVTATIAVFIKLTYFFPLLVFLSLYLLAVTFLKTGLNRKKVFLIYVCNILLFLSFCYLLRVDFKEYIIASLHIVSAYNEAMMELPSKESAFTYLLQGIFSNANASLLSLIILSITILITSPFLLTVFYSVRRNKFNHLTLLTAIFCLIFLFLTFKYAFVRHGGLSYLYPPVLLYLFGLMTCFSSVREKWRRYYVYFICIVLFVPSVLLVNKHIMLRKTFTYYSLLEKAKSLFRKQSSDSSNRQNEPFTHIIPDSIKNQIGANTVDVIPMEISFTHFNHLQYHPRPVIQSYTAYDAYLDTKNFNFYNSANAPHFVIYTTNTIDNRYHFYDEPKTKFNLLRHYDFVDSFPNQVLLKRRAVSRSSAIIRQESTEILLNNEFTISNKKILQLSSFNIQYTTLGSIVRFLYQPPLIQITFYLENGTAQTHRLVKSAVEVPVLVNKYISDNRDFVNLFSNNIDSIATIKSIKISAPEWAYKKMVSVKSEWTILEEVR